jgi:hypothetical protein
MNDESTPPPADPNTPALPEDVGMDKQERELGMICHLLGFCAFTGIPMGHLLGPLVLWLIKKEEFPFVDQEGKEAVNFQITSTIIGIFVLVISIPMAMTGIGLCLVIPLVIALSVVWIVFVVLAAMESNKGRPYRYPINFRFIS